MKRHRLSEQFKTHCNARFPNLNQEKILLAASGGRDSMALATLLLENGFQFGIAHCNYQLRGAESAMDAAIVRDFAQNWQLAFHYIEFDPVYVAGDNKSGLQERARTLRYDWFSELRSQYGYTVLMTAHHANDTVETLLINLAKGTGLKGLHGIPHRNEWILRPLLFATRQQITGYVQEQAIAFRDDRSNETSDYNRNAIRHQVIPALEQIFPQTVSAIAQSIDRFAAAETYYKLAIEQERKKILQQRGPDIYIPIKRLQKSPEVPTLLFELLLPFGFSAAQTQEVLKLLKAGSGHFIASGTHKVVKDRDMLIVSSIQPDQTDILNVEQANCSLETPEGLFRFSEIPLQDMVDEGAGCIYVDAGKIHFPLTLRRRRAGDYFYPSGFGMKKKKVSKLLIDKKVSLPDKERVWILCSGLHILWVAGFRADERFLAGNTTKKILRIEFISRG